MSIIVPVFIFQKETKDVYTSGKYRARKQLDRYQEALDRLAILQDLP